MLVSCQLRLHHHQRLHIAEGAGTLNLAFITILISILIAILVIAIFVTISLLINIFLINISIIIR